MSPDAEWFEEQTDASAVKADIVSAYFAAWARIMVGQAKRIAYIDLYAGPGRYISGAESTPLRVLAEVLASDELRAKTLTFFNDADPDLAARLQSAINALPGIKSLTHQPDVEIGPVAEHYSALFEDMRTIPVLGFLDPWGYKGLSLRLIRGLIKDFGCEAIFFFNYNRINMAIRNPKVTRHMEALFGAERLAALRISVKRLNPVGREREVEERIREALSDAGANFVLPFRFRRSNGRLSHVLYHVSEHELPYSIMKGVMAKRGVIDDDGVPRFDYFPQGAGTQVALGDQPPIVELEALLLSEFAGRALSVKEIVRVHNVGRVFIEPNYKLVLRKLRDSGRVVCERDKPIRKNQMPDDVVVRFPE